MRGLWTLFITYLVALTSVLAKAPQIFGFIEKTIQREVAAVKQPIDETLTFVGTTQCSNVKKIIGVSYEQVRGEKEPDLNSLSLVYKTETVTTVINITSATNVLNQILDFKKGKLIIYFHGFTDDPTSKSFGNISVSFFKAGHSNIIALDGSSLIKWLYLRSTTYIQFMGEKMGELLAGLVHQGFNPSSIHIIGHSLGAHIAGFSGKTFQKLTGLQVGRITGLDPAGPCFSHVDPDLRLKASDASFVDVIHTDAGVYGINDPVGHVDFYPNSGRMQPNCLFQTCSHSRAWVLFGESVLNYNAFPAVKCKSWEAFKKGHCENEISLMGYPTRPETRGLFFLQTADIYPFGLGEEGLRYRNNDGVVKSLTNIIGI